MRSDRIALWDNVKASLILLVVIGHFADVYSSGVYKSAFLFIYSFHMPLFFFVAGLFAKQEKDWAQRQALAYLALYVLLKSIFFAEKRLLGMSASFVLLKESGLPWFMFSMACFSLLGWLLRRVPLKHLLPICLLTACFAGYDQSVKDYLVLSRNIVYFPFFLLGSRMGKERLLRLREKRGLRWAALGVLLLWAFLCLYCRTQLYPLRPLFTGRNPYGDMSYGALRRLLCYGIATLVGLSLILVTPERRFRLSVLGQRTLQIYFWHYIVLFVLMYGKLHTYLCRTPAGKIAWLLLAVALCLALAWRPFGFPARTIMDTARGTGTEKS